MNHVLVFLFLVHCAYPSTSTVWRQTGESTKQITTHIRNVDNDDPCASGPCFFNGTCISMKNGKDFICRCQDGYYGKICNSRNICDIKPCQNNATCFSTRTDYKCYCPYGLTGKNCTEIDKRDLCERKPCVFGTCELVDGGKDYLCHCEKDMYGRNCSTGNICEIEPCLNNGTCTSYPGSRYTCTCPFGFVGQNCSEVDTRDLCERKPCFLGTCSLIENGTDYVCHCDEGIYGRNCTTGNICEIQPCENGGSCVSYVRSKYTCICPPLVTGKNCSIFIPPPCESNPCQNGGTCVSKGNDYECVCTKQYLGKACENEITPCTSSPCKNGGTCEVKEMSNHTCTCVHPFAGRNCEIMTINPCVPNPCLHGKCLPVKTMDEEPSHLYTCDCQKGFAGFNCSEYSWCSEGDGKKLCSRAQCSFDIRAEVGYCVCPEGKFYNYRTWECEELDKCWFGKKCKLEHELCVKSNCVCAPHYKYNADRTKCIADFCRGRTCGVNETCQEDAINPGNTLCNCSVGFIFNGTACVEDEFCLRGVCQQICFSSNRSCGCRKGFELDKDGLSCKLQGESICRKQCGKGTCILIDGVESCECPAAHVYQNESCVHICESKSAGKTLCPGGGCVKDSTYGYRCICENKYKTSTDGVTCGRKFTCSSRSARSTCRKKNAVCREDPLLESGYRCVCRDGDAEDEKRKVCKGLCDLEKNRADCRRKEATCYRYRGSKTFECKCPPAFRKLDGKCTKLAEHSYIGNLLVSKDVYFAKRVWDIERLRRDISKSANLLHPNLISAEVLNCADSSSTCTVEMQFFSDPLSQVNLLSLPQMCFPLEQNPRACVVPPGLVLAKSKRFGRFQVMKLCDKIVKEANCGKEMDCTEYEDRSFKCACGVGFQKVGEHSPTADGRSVIEKCVEIDECSKPTSCQPNSRCVNTYGSYHCFCTEGYRPYNNSVSVKESGCVKICEPNPCGNGICSPVGDHYYSCRCHPGRTGENCEELLSPVIKESFVNTSIVGAVLGLALLVSTIVFAHRIRRLKNLTIRQRPNVQSYPEFPGTAGSIEMSEHLPPQERQPTNPEHEVVERL